MKKISKIIPLIISIWACLFILPSCDKMDDIQSEYASREEGVYLGKVDSIKYFPGFGRAKITWYIGADPKIDQTVIYWNMRKDSIVKDFVRKGSGLQRDSVILEDLPEGTTLFEFRNINKEGETSLYSSASITVWGAEFASSLYGRDLTAFDFNYPENLYTLELSESVPNENVSYSQIVYTDLDGQEKTLKIKPEEVSVELPNFPDGGEFQFRTVFFPTQGIDTVYNEFEKFSAPTAVSERGTRISLTGNLTSKYFDRNGENLYEWNADGDIIVYNINVDGTLSKIQTYAGIVPRDTYRDFFFYDDDKFIGISTGNAVSMHRIVNNELVYVQTPTGANTFGSGFGFEKFIPTRGYFFSMAENGEMKTWLAQNNATWGSPNGATVGTGYAIYEPFLLFNHVALLGVEENGNLASMPVSASGSIGSKSTIGSGWDRFEKIVNAGTKLYGIEANGDIYVFNDFNLTEKYWIVD